MVALSDHNHFIEADTALEKTPLTISAGTKNQTHLPLKQGFSLNLEADQNQCKLFIC